MPSAISTQHQEENEGTDATQPSLHSDNEIGKNSVWKEGSEGSTSQGTSENKMCALMCMVVTECRGKGHTSTHKKETEF